MSLQDISFTEDDNAKNVYVVYRIRTDNLIADELSSFLEIQPTEAHSEGEINRSEPYPNVTVRDYGKVPFPKNAEYTLPSLRTPRSSTYRSNYIDAWSASGKPEPISGWANYRIHHIQPLEYGGTNDISNLVHLPQPIHDLFTQW